MKLNLPNIRKSIGHFFCIALTIILTACSSGKPGSQGKPEKNLISVQLNVGAQENLLAVCRDGDSIHWQANTLADLTFWDEEGKEQHQAVSNENGWKLENAKVGQGNNLSCSQAQSGISFIVRFTKKDDILTVNIPSSEMKESEKARLKSLRLLPRFGAAAEDDPRYLVTSRGVGTLTYFKDKEPAESRVPVYQYINNCTMPLYGIVRGASGLAVIVTNGQYDTQFCVSTNWGTQHQYAIDPEFTIRSFIDEQRLPDDLEVQYHLLSANEANWLGVAKRYRKYNFDQRGIIPLKQRVLKSPELAYSARSMEVRLRLAVKPIPYKIVEQTPETEPPVRVFLTFKQVRDIFDEFHSQGIKGAEFCLVGWNIGGHDGRYPQLFPVEPSLGGETELRKTIEYGQSLGYQVVAHDDYYGAYRIAEEWDESYIRKNADGQLNKGGIWGGGQSYNSCLTRAFDLFAKRDMPKIRELGFKGVHFSDVLSILGPKPCYDPDHPETRRQDAEATNRILSLARENFGGVQSEGSLDFTAPALDRFMYIYNGEASLLEVPYVDKCIPLYPAVYHGVMLYNVSHKTLNTLPGEGQYLKNIEYGSLPLIYFYGHFILDESKNWMGDHDNRYDSREGLQKAVAGIKQVYDDCEKLNHLQLEFIEDHNQLADGVFETVYSNGERVVVNFNDNSYKLPTGEIVPSLGWSILK